MSRPTFINSTVVYNDHSTEYNIDARGNKDIASVIRACKAEDVQAEEAPTADIPLFKYIHPCITDDKEKRKIHGEVANLVRTLPLPEICRYMRRMYKEKRIYLNVKIEAMFDELHRMGLPDEETPGYSLKNFQNYFNMND